MWDMDGKMLGLYGKGLAVVKTRSKARCQVSGARGQVLGARDWGLGVS